MPTEQQRAHMARIMDVLVARSGRVHYGQRRPMGSRDIHTDTQLRLALLRLGGITMDCSESVTLICHIAGLRDPNGLHYNGSGFTGTLLEHLHHRATPGRVGSMCVFGAPPGVHVIMRRDTHRWFTHGTENDPRYFTLQELIDAFPGKPHTFLSIASL